MSSFNDYNEEEQFAYFEGVKHGEKATLEGVRKVIEKKCICIDGLTLPCGCNKCKLLRSILEELGL